MAYVEYSPEYFPCRVPGCGNSVIVTDQSTLHWYHTYSGGERPKGYDICADCEALLPTLSVDCLNRPLCEDDSGCIGNGRINLMSECGHNTAWWYLLSGMGERPKFYLYCQTCKGGVVYTAPCRNVGCRGDHQIRCTGNTKQGLVLLTQQRGEAFWPVKNCDECREFIDSLHDVATQCKCCFKHWVFSAGRQIMLVRNESRDRFKVPDFCDGCLSLSEDQRKEIRQSAAAALKQREARRILKAQLASKEGRAALHQTKKETFLRVARRFIQAPDSAQVETKVKMAALSRISQHGGEETVTALHHALNTRGVNAGIVARGLANPSIKPHQAVQLAKSLAILGRNGQFPAGLIERCISGIGAKSPERAQAAAYEICASTLIMSNPHFPIKFSTGDIVFHYKFLHNRRYERDIDTSKFRFTERTCEGDIVLKNVNALIEFKHSVNGTPSINAGEVQRIEGLLRHGQIDQAIVVSSHELKGKRLIAQANQRIAQYNADHGWDVPLIKTFTQEW